MSDHCPWCQGPCLVRAREESMMRLRAEFTELVLIFQNRQSVEKLLETLEIPVRKDDPR